MKKYIKFTFIFVILLCISLGTFFYVKADSGWDSDYGSSSSSSSWGGSSYDSGSSSSSSGGGGGGGCVNDYSIPLSILLCLIVYLICRKKGIFKPSNNISNTNYYPDLLDGEYYINFKMYKDEFKQIISKKFIDIQKSWMNFDYDNLRKLCTDELYNQYKTLLEVLKLKNEQNVMSDFNVKNISIYYVKKVNNVTIINVYLDIQFRDYVINTNNNKVVRGNKNIYFNNCYELEFIMSCNDKTIKCPSCGANIDVVSSNVCEYCHNTIVQVSDELVLSKKKIVASYKSKG